MKINYTITGMSAGLVNVVQNNYCAGIPSPTAFIGFASALFEKIGLDQKEAKVIPVLHMCQVSTGRTLGQQIPASKDDVKSQDMHTDMPANIRFSVLIQTDASDIESDLKKVVPAMRFGGKPIFGDIEAKRVERDGRAMRSLERGYAIVPPINEVNRGVASFGDEASWKQVSQFLMKERATADGDQVPNVGWRVPVAIGYEYIKGFRITNKSLLRDPNKPHSFASPGVGIAELVSVKNHTLSEMTAEEIDDLFLQWSFNSDKVVIHNSYL